MSESLRSDLLSAIERGLRKERSAPGVSLDGNTIRGRASTLAKDCLRALWYEAHGEPKADLSLTAESVFEQGHFWHDRVRLWLREAGIDLHSDEMEVHYKAEGLEVVGHIDGLVNHGGKTYLLDIKSASDYGFKKAGEEAPDAAYSRQLAIYQAGLIFVYRERIDIDGACLLYVAKESKGEPSGVAAVRGSTQGIEAVAKVVFVDIAKADPFTRLDAIRKETPPDPLPPAEEVERMEFRGGKDKSYEAVDILPWNCSYCLFAKTCRPKARAALKRTSVGKSNGVPVKNTWLEENPDKQSLFDKWILYERKGV